jgi:hypothetical protein
MSRDRTWSRELIACYLVSTEDDDGLDDNLLGLMETVENSGEDSSTRRFGFSSHVWRFFLRGSQENKCFRTNLRIFRPMYSHERM